MRKTIGLLVSLCLLGGVFYSNNLVAEELNPAAGKANLARINGQANAFLAGELGVPLASIKSARQEGYPFSYALFFACAASKGGVKVRQVVELYDSGLNWQQVCDSLGIDLKNVSEMMSKIVKAMNAANVEIPAATMGEKEKLFSVKPRVKEERGE